MNTYGSGFFRITVIPYLYPQFIWIYRLPFPDPQFILPGIQLFANQLIAFFFHPETCNSTPQLISKRIFHGIKTQVINSGSHLHLIIQLIRFVSPPTDERSRQPGEITADRKEGVQKVFGTLDLFVSLLETEIKYPILQGGILPFWTPSFIENPESKLKPSGLTGCSML